MAKIYLSPAAHEHDNPCSYSSVCSENTHCNLYVDWLEKHLLACGSAQGKKVKKSEIVAERLLHYLNENYARPLSSRKPYFSPTASS